MTGSGKTGLCLSILEEAAIDGVPVIAVDPKGDLGNLLLTFPDLAPEDFRPWVNEDDARRKGVSVDQFAADQAAKWKSGLAEWGQDGARIGRLRAAADFAIYTPGSSAGLPISILRSLDAPPPALMEDRELFAERVSTTATSLLTLAGIEAEPARSREHTLLTSILRGAWSGGRSLDLAGLIQQIQTPPVQRIGVLELESFFPAPDRFDLATAFNNLLAAPGFEAWLDGEPLAIDRLLYTPEGKPRVAIISIAHLGDRERMFFVSLLLNELLAWMRAQQGTTSLRALFYMDEVFGFFPPVANPPSKTPLLTLLKQGRAFGLGCLLATQNPVDLDYKGLANCGTWWLGRLQTERDKARVLDGLEGAITSGGGRFDRAYVDRALSGLSSRVFLMNNVHEDAPVVLESRWAMSYLRGPLTREQIKVLMGAAKGRAGAGCSDGIERWRGGGGRHPGSAAGQRGRHLSRSRRPARAAAGDSAVLRAGGGSPACFRRACAMRRWRLASRASGSRTRSWASARRGPSPCSPASTRGSAASTGLRASSWTSPRRSSNPNPRPRAVSWPSRRPPPRPSPTMRGRRPSGPGWAEPDARRGAGAAAPAWCRLPASPNATSGSASRRRRASSATRRWSSCGGSTRAKLATLDDKIRRAEQAVERESAQATQQKLQTAVSMGATVLGALFGRKAFSTSTLGRATTAARGMGRTMKESQDIGRARETARGRPAAEGGARGRRCRRRSSALGGALDPLTEALEADHAQAEAHGALGAAGRAGVGPRDGSTRRAGARPPIGEGPAASGRRSASIPGPCVARRTRGRRLVESL